MLTLIKPEEFAGYVDWAYSLALDLTRSGYPTYADGIKTRDGFAQAAREGMRSECEELLLFRADGEVCGWIQWSWMPEEQYAQAYSFLTASHTDRALAEFTAHAAEKCPGYALHLGFPTNNAKAVRWLANHDYRLLEVSVNHTLFFDRYMPREVPTCVRLMSGRDDETAFRALHTDADLYWTAERILNHPSDWRVYLYAGGDRATAALYALDRGGWPEIFGMAGDVTAEAYRALMTACLNDCKAAGTPHMTYFEEDERRLPILADLGFEMVSRYVCYQKKL